MRSIRLFGILALASTLAAHAENAVVLESFESGVNCAAVDSSSDGRPALNPPGVALSQYSRTSGHDSNVTEGSKSLKIVLSGRKKFSHDFLIKLSMEASDKIRKAAASPDVARYILRYDVIFPPLDDFNYFNSALFFGDCRDVLISAGGLRTMSVALDLLTGLPAEGPLTLSIADDFDVKGEFTNVAVYLDNIRLVDTYAPGAKPVVHVLQSFEDAKYPLGGVTNFTDWDADGNASIRTAFNQYTSSGPHDLRVTNGKYALQVINHNPAAWHADFIIPLNNTMLAEILKLDKPPDQRPAPQELSRYTLRWDITYPDLTNEWMNSTFHTIATFLPIIQGNRVNVKNHPLTYSITLDQAEWGTWNDMSPVLLFITEGPQKSRDTKTYYDNFRLIDTGAAPSSTTRKTTE